jgi:hypothetical protein
MKRYTLTPGLILAAGLALMLATLQATAQPRIAAGRGMCYLNQLAPGSAAAPTQPLTEAEKTALLEAIEDEYKSRATYNGILDTFGQVLPFANIVNAETRHAEALAFLLTRYGVPVPADTWTGKVPAYATLKEAGEAAVQAEIENGNLYDSLLAKTSNPEVINVFKALQFATREHHLPAFQRLVAVQSGQVPATAAMGRGAGRGACCAAGICPVQGYVAPSGWNPGAGPGRGQGLGAQTGNGRGKGIRGNAGIGRGRGQGMRGASGAGLGRGAGPGAGQGWAAGLNPYCPYNANVAR